MVVSEDTDIAVLLIHHSKNDTPNLFMLRPGKAAKVDRITNIQALQIKLRHLKPCILFLHAVSGCDTTSFIFKKTKKSCMRILKNDMSLCANLDIFLEENPDKKKLIEIGLKFFKKLYYLPNTSQDLDGLRFSWYNRITSRQGLSSSFNLAALPPTTDAAEQHILRVVYFQLKLKILTIFRSVIIL